MPTSGRSPGAGRSRWACRPKGTKPHLAIAAWEWGKYFAPEIAAKGLRLDIAPWRRPAPYTAPVHSKAAGLYMIASLSKKHADDRGYDDALMFDWRGQVAEATGANAFFVQDGKLYTPTPDCFLDGITRRTVMDLARRRGVEVDRTGNLAGRAGKLRADVHHRLGRRSDLHPVGRSVELRNRRTLAPTAARIMTTWSTGGC